MDRRTHDQRPRYWGWLDTRRLVLLVTLAAVFAMAGRVPVDGDGWWHLASGRYIVERGSIPRADPFSHTKAGAPWIDNGWLSQVGFYLLYRWLGYAGLGLLVATAAAAALALVWLQMTGGPFVRAFILVLAAIVSGPVWTVRPHLATYVLTASLGWLLYLWRRGRRWALWVIPLLFVLWVNLHAGYTLGLALLASTAVGEGLDRLSDVCYPRRRDTRSWREIASLAAVGALALLLVPLNPYGFEMWGYPFYNAGQQVARQYIAEWASPDFHRLVNQPFAVILLLTLLVVGLSDRRGRWAELLPVVGFAYLTLQSQRTMGLFAVIAAPVLSRYLGKPGLFRKKPGFSEKTRFLRGRALLNGTLALLLVGAALLKAGAVWRPSVVEAAVRQMGFPVDGADWIAQQRPAGLLYNPYQWGGYLIWQLTPDYPVFVDGRADLYGDEFLLDHLDLAAAAPGWEASLEAWGVRTALVTPEGALSRAMAASPNWERAYEDEVAVVYVRR
jgi:hypothetical protein